MDWGYISGFFDADGCITFTRRSKNKFRSPEVILTNTYYEIIKDIYNFIYTELGIKGIIVTHKKENKKWKTAYVLSYRYLPTCLLLLKFIVSHHPKKKHRIKLVSEILPAISRRNGRYTKEILLKREEFERDFFKEI